MSRTIPHRELRNNSSAVLRDVAAGETVYVTNNGEVVAALVPPPRAGAAAVRVRRATVHGGFAELARTRVDRPVQEVLDELRDER
ncbi:MAG: type II toxin-antitoxin system prevent-host-death family antitoxin [Pseudonocardia sp.]|nr:type II toxin-antitoxin system prevent-host-death family antitoxin [Pseudonocardia sp.]